MTHIGVGEALFHLLLASARYGSHVNLTSADFRLSEEQVVGLLQVVAETHGGRLILRRNDYDQVWLLMQVITFPMQLELK
ncbi:hypothetical protein AWB65_05362 [Caballeronia humi]|uniref:Uncharacterized protein n=2 Tax=Caballeronia humi TaxID=326474 RepID=A0A158IUH4_9BURK|nr:hypothetical protein AWB65_05362 [Caballeronia humi]